MMDKPNVTYSYNGTLFSLLKQGDPCTMYNTDELRGHYVKWNKPLTKRQLTTVWCHLCEILRVVKFLEAESKSGDSWLSLVVLVVIHLPVWETEETWVLSLDREDPLEKNMATHSSILAWRIPWTEQPGGLQSIGSQSQTPLKWVSTYT